MKQYFSRFSKLLFLCIIVLFFGKFSSLCAQDFISLEIKGNIESKILKDFESRSKLHRHKAREISTDRFIKKLLSADIDLLKDLLETFGYYEASFTSEVKRLPWGVHVTIFVRNLQRYFYGNIQAKCILGDFDSKIRENLRLIIDPLKGKFVEARDLFEEFKAIEETFHNLGFPFAKIESHQGRLDSEAKHLHLEIMVVPGKRLKFGKIKVEGAADLPITYIHNRAAWQEGDLFDLRKINQYQEKLYKTDKISQVLINFKEEDVSEGKLDIHVKLKERKPRTISGGVRYSLGDGVGGVIGWEHRNISTHADKLSTKIQIGRRDSRVGLDYEMPDFWALNKTFLADLAGIREKTEAYERKGGKLSASLKTDLDENKSYFYGMSLEKFKVTKNKIDTNYHAIGFPLGFQINNVDDLLGPTSGYKLSVALTPELSAGNAGKFLTRLLLNASHYYAVTQKTTLAHWGRVGTIFGIKDDQLISDRRFYAGGGGSLRAYGYQLAGPIDSDKKPVGGKLLIEGGAELRQKFNKDWGGALFFEAAHVGSGLSIQSDKNLFYGVGVGVRYYTDIGPIRFDVAFPLSKIRKVNREKVDRSVQFYISLGQSF